MLINTFKSEVAKVIGASARSASDFFRVSDHRTAIVFHDHDSMIFYIFYSVDGVTVDHKKIGNIKDFNAFISDCYNVDYRYGETLGLFIGMSKKEHVKALNKCFSYTISPDMIQNHPPVELSNKIGNIFIELFNCSNEEVVYHCYESYLGHYSSKKQFALELWNELKDENMLDDENQSIDDFTSNIFELFFKFKDGHVFCDNW